MSDAERVLIGVAVVQAASAVVVATFTVKLVRWTRKLSEFTSEYVEEMRQTNALQEEANRLTQSSLAIAQGQAAPLLTIRSGGRNSDGSTYVEAVTVVENKGGGPAKNVVVDTSWGDAPLDAEVLVAGQQSTAKVRIAYVKGKKGSDPQLRSVRYEDTSGNRYEEPAPEPRRARVW